MNKGEAQLSASQMKRLSTRTVAAEKYDEEVLDLAPKKIPQSIPEIVEIKMAENSMTPAKLAQELGVGKSKISETLSGKRNSDLVFVKE